MGKRMATVLAATDIGASGTKVVDIRLREQITALFIDWQYTTVTVSVNTGHPLDCLSKIEVVDGSKVLFSASGRAAQAIAYSELGVMPKNELSLTVGGICRSVVPVLFGRKFFDRMYALVPDMYDNPQVRITFDEDAANGSVVVNSLAIYALVDDNPAGGKANGFLLNREQKSYGMAASAHEYTDLPTDFPIRKLFVQALSEDHDTIDLLTNVKVDVENGRDIPVDLPAGALLDIVSLKYGRVEEDVTLDNAVTIKAFYPTCTQDGAIAIEYDAGVLATAGAKFAVATIAGEKITTTVSATIKALTAKVSGYLPHGVIPVEFGDPEEHETWLQTAGVNSIRADVQASSDADSGDTTTLITQQSVMYGQR